MSKINIVLLEPQIPQNTGNIARTCAVCGAALHLIEPMGFKITEKSVKRAGLDYWSSVEIYYYEDINHFFSINKGAFYFFTTKAKCCYTDVSFDSGEDNFFFFGREDAGLPEELLSANAESCLRIPMRDSLRSLNLSNSAAVAVYELLRQWDFPMMR